ncbi:GDSL-like Lipase/Acylhydrolase superfamily protein [Wolffia australiana]
MAAFKLAILFIFTAVVTVSGSGGRRFTKIYAFGDSFTDTGNTNDSLWPFSFGHAHQLPYGSTYGKPTGRYSDGLLVVDFLASLLGLPTPPPYLRSTAAGGANFAVAGATAVDHSFYVRNNVTLDLVPTSLGTQMRWFDGLMEKMGCGRRRRRSAKACAAEMEDALFWVGEIGVNDNAYIVGSQVSAEQVEDLALDSIARFLEGLLKRGAKYMVVQGHPLTGCLPLTLTLVPADDEKDEFGCSAAQNRRNAAVNARLLATLDDLRRRHPAAVIAYADYAAAHRAVIRRPKAFGFKEPFRTCCGSGGGRYNFDLFATCATPAVTSACTDPRSYVNWDGAHLTEAMYRVLADMFLHRGFCRPSFEFLLSRKSGRS